MIIMRVSLGPMLTDYVVDQFPMATELVHHIDVTPGLSLALLLVFLPDLSLVVCRCQALAVALVFLLVGSSTSGAYALGSLGL